ncbi:MAG: hypothetical protein DI562_11980 [Stenotrophomonas acidaminiphila]|nr:MAG: hypothetical protein DI562_11980 [Stenotrophomonas acidaminiphila]
MRYHALEQTELVVVEQAVAVVATDRQRHRVHAVVVAHCRDLLLHAEYAVIGVVCIGAPHLRDRQQVFSIEHATRGEVRRRTANPRIDMQVERLQFRRHLDRVGAMQTRHAAAAAGDVVAKDAGEMAARRLAELQREIVEPIRIQDRFVQRLQHAREGVVVVHRRSPVAARGSCPTHLRRS